VSGPWLRSVELVRVLVVDDQRLVTDAIRRVLGAVCMVEVAACGLEALALVRAGRRYVAILCDVMMPTATGFEVLDELRRDAPEQARRVILMTGSVNHPEDEQRLASAGCLVLIKPFGRSELMRALAGFLPGTAPRGSTT